MPRAALIWTQDEAPHVAAVSDARETIIGRSGEADVQIDESTVSRRHARIAYENGAFLVANLSGTTVTRVNDVEITRPVPLSDGDTVKTGAIESTFHDLSSGDRISGPMCSHCGRENRADDDDCWYCGTSLVNAPTAQLRAQRVLFRLIDSSGERFDVHDGETFFIAGGNAGVAEAVPDTHDLTVQASGAEVTVSGEVSVNGEAVDGPGALATGDQIETGGRALLVVLR